MIEYKEVKIGDETDKGYEKLIWLDKEIWYMLDGIIHREDGPAIIFPDGREEYFLNDVMITPDIYHEFTPIQLAKLGLI